MRFLSFTRGARPLALFALMLAATWLWPACSSTRSCRDGTLFVTVQLGDLASATHDLQVTVSLDGVAEAPLTFMPEGRALARSESLELGLPQRAQHPAVAVTVVARAATGGELARASTPAPVPVTEACLALTIAFEGTDAGAGGSTANGGRAGSAAGGAPGIGGSKGGAGGNVGGGAGGNITTGGTSAIGGAAAAGHGGAVATGGMAGGGSPGGKAGGGQAGSATGGAGGGPATGGATGGQGNAGGVGGATASGGVGGAGGAAPPRCGDGIIQSNEQCDDSNSLDKDGCASNCRIEPGFQCQGMPSVCTPVLACPQTSYPNGNWDRTNAMSTVLTSVSMTGIQDLLAGAAIDGGTLLVMRGSCGSTGPIWLFDGSIATGAYTGVDVTAGLSGLNLSEARFSMAPDGLTVLSALPGAGAYGVALRKRASRATTTFGAVQTAEFANVNSWAAAKSAAIILPALSPDGLSLFFTATVAGAADTHYEVTRAQAGGVFDTPGAPIGGNLIGWGAITASSADRLTVYADKNYRTDSFVRASLTAPFVKQTTTQIQAIRVYPADAGCHKLVGNSQPGGCLNEDIYVMSD
jgi:cysteine-rich repeat protein